MRDLLRILGALCAVAALSALRAKFALESVRGQATLLQLGLLHDLFSVGLLVALLSLRPSGRGARRALAGVKTVVVVGLLFGNALGWGFYSGVGLFPDLSSIRFAAEYGSTNWLTEFVFSTERRALGIGLGVSSLLFVLSLLCLSGQRMNRKLLAGFTAASVVALGVFLHQSSELTVRHHFTQAVREQFLRQGLGPLTTLSLEIIRRPKRSESNDRALRVKLVPELQRHLRPRGSFLEECLPAEIPRDPLSIILVSVESLRPDATAAECNGQPVMPFLRSLLERSVVFKRAYAPSTHSDYSDPAVYASRFPLFGSSHVYFSPTDTWSRPVLHSVLKRIGYQTGHFSSQNESWGGMRFFLPKDAVDVLFDPESANLPTYVNRKDVGAAWGKRYGSLRKGNLPDEATAQAALGWIESSAKKGPFLLSLNLQTTHFPYELPPGEKPFCGEAIFDSSISYVRYSAEKTELVKRGYYNALHSIDGKLEILFKRLGEFGLADRTAIVLYGDNGESFNEQGLTAHGSHPFETQSRVFLSVTAPGHLEAKTRNDPVSLLDVAPSLLELAAKASCPEFQGERIFDLPEDLSGARTVWIHVDSPLARSDGVVADGRWKYFIDRKRGAEFLFDLERDPSEAMNLAEACGNLRKALRLSVDRVRTAHVLYYSEPSVHGGYYPPRLPDLHPREEERLCSERDAVRGPSGG